MNKSEIGAVDVYKDFVTDSETEPEQTEDENENEKQNENEEETKSYASSTGRLSMKRECPTPASDLNETSSTSTAVTAPSQRQLPIDEILPSQNGKNRTIFFMNSFIFATCNRKSRSILFWARGYFFLCGRWWDNKSS